jgi:hypothetical protein
METCQSAFPGRRWSSSRYSTKSATIGAAGPSSSRTAKASSPTDTDTMPLGTILDSLAGDPELGAQLAEIAAYALLVGGMSAVLLVGVLVWFFFGFAVEHDE